MEMLIVLIMGLLFFVTPTAMIVFFLVRYRNNSNDQARVQRELVEDLLEENRNLHDEINRLRANDRSPG